MSYIIPYSRPNFNPPRQKSDAEEARSSRLPFGLLQARLKYAIIWVYEEKATESR